MMEHSLGALTDCNHGEGPALLHPVYYRRICEAGQEKFARFAIRVWDIAPKEKTALGLAKAGVEVLTAFIREIGLPTTLGQLGITGKNTDLTAVADSCAIVGGSYQKLTHKEIYEILWECL